MRRRVSRRLEGEPCQAGRADLTRSAPRLNPGSDRGAPGSQGLAKHAGLTPILLACVMLAAGCSANAAPHFERAGLTRPAPRGVAPAQQTDLSRPAPRKLVPAQQAA